MTQQKRSLNDLRNRLADCIEKHPPEDWSPELLDAFIAVMDLHFAEGGTNKAPVLELVKR